MVVRGRATSDKRVRNPQDLTLCVQLSGWLTAEGGRVPGAGKLAYLVNGHDMQAFGSPEFRKLWINTIRWLLDQPPA